MATTQAKRTPTKIGGNACPDVRVAATNRGNAVTVRQRQNALVLLKRNACEVDVKAIGKERRMSECTHNAGGKRVLKVYEREENEENKRMTPVTQTRMSTNVRKIQNNTVDRQQRQRRRVNVQRKIGERAEKEVEERHGRANR